jgi:hypothetical protein
MSVDADMLAEIRGMKPWLRFFSILGFLLAALFLAAAFFGAVILAPREGAPGLGGIVAIAAFLLYGGIAAFTAFTALNLFRAANRADEIQSDPSRENMVSFLRLNRKFWKAIGIFCFAMLSLYLTAAFILLVLELMKKTR